MTPERIDLFNDWAPGYDRSVQSAQGFPFSGYDTVLDRIVLLADAIPEHRIIDLGVGTGSLARRFLDLGCPVSGIDFSPRMLELARLKVPEATLAEGDISGPWPAEVGGRFDRIVSAYTFHHFDLNQKVALLLRLVERHLAPGGIIVVGDIGFSTEQSLVEARNQAGERWDDSEHYWVAQEAIEAISVAGLCARYVQVSECAGVFVICPESMA